MKNRNKQFSSTRVNINAAVTAPYRFPSGRIVLNKLMWFVLQEIIGHLFIFLFSRETGGLIWGPPSDGETFDEYPMYNYLQNGVR